MSSKRTAVKRTTSRQAKTKGSAEKTSTPQNMSAGSKPSSPEEFNAQTVAQRVHSARKTADTQRREIIGLMTSYTAEQRESVSWAYESMYDQNLLDDLSGELGGNLLDLCTALFTPRWEYTAGWIDKAIQHRGHPRETVLVEMICCNSENDLGHISTAYFAMFGIPLANALRSGLEGNLQKLCLALVENRQENGKVNVEKARKMAMELHREHHGTNRLLDAGRLLDLMSSPASFSQLRQVILEYDRLTTSSLEDDIRMLGDDEFPSALMAAVKSIKNHQGFLADQLHFAIDDLSLFDETLIRISVTRAEVDLPAVKRAFRQKYGLSLEEVVARDTVGDYSTVLTSVMATGDSASGDSGGSGSGTDTTNGDIYRRTNWMSQW